jgi:Holliday junction resolvase
MPRPQLYPVKKVIGFDRTQLSAIEKWRRRQDPIPNVSEAIRKLVTFGLKAKGTRKL